MWTPQKIDWLALADDREFERAIEELLSDNPVLVGAVIRPTGHKSSRELYSDVSQVAQRELERALRNPGAYHTSGLVQMAVVHGVNKYLITRHYIFLLLRCGPKPAVCPIFLGQVWYPASYLIVSGTQVFDWETNAPLYEFYDPMTAVKGRRPSITLGVDSDGLYSMIPCSRSRGGKRVRVGFLGYACWYFVYRASWVMLHGDPKAASRYKNLRVTDAELAKIMELM